MDPDADDPGASGGEREPPEGTRKAYAGDAGGADSDPDHCDVDRVFRHPGDAGDDAWPREVGGAARSLGFEQTGTDEQAANVQYD